MDRSQFQFCPNSSNFTILQGKIANYSYAITGALGLTTTLVLLFLLILYKAFKTALQRQFLYFTLAVAVSDIIQVLNVELQFDVNRDFCSWLGFLDQWTSLSSNLLVIGLVVYISAVTCQKLRPAKSIGLHSRTISTKCFVLLEVSYLCAVISIPAAGFSVLLKERRYGLSESLCWLRVYDEGCHPVKNHSSSFSIVVLFLHVIMLAILFLMVPFHVMILKYQPNSEVSRNTSCRASILLAIVFASIVARVGESASYLIKHPVNQFYYVLVDEIVQSVINNLLPLGFAGYLYSPKKLKLSFMKEAVKRWCVRTEVYACWCLESRACSCRKFRRLCCEASRSSSTHFSKHAGMEDLHRINRCERNEFGESEKTNSKHESQPSYTYFNIEHTGEFTKITDQNACAAKYGSLVVTNRCGQKHGRDKISVSLNSDYKSLPSSTNWLEHTGEFTTTTDCDECACKKCKRGSNFNFTSHKNKQEKSTSSQSVETVAGTFTRSNSHNAGHEEQQKELDAEDSRLAQTSCFSRSPPSSHHSLEDTREFIRSSSYSYTKPEGTTVAHKWGKQHEEIELKDSTTFKISGRVSPPSATCFSIEYTGEFTSVMDYDTHICTTQRPLRVPCEDLDTVKTRTKRSTTAVPLSKMT